MQRNHSCRLQFGRKQASELLGKQAAGHSQPSAAAAKTVRAAAAAPADSTCTYVQAAETAAVLQRVTAVQGEEVAGVKLNTSYSIWWVLQRTTAVPVSVVDNLILHTWQQQSICLLYTSLHHHWCASVHTSVQQADPHSPHA